MESALSGVPSADRMGTNLAAHAASCRQFSDVTDCAKTVRRTNGPPLQTCA